MSSYRPTTTRNFPNTRQTPTDKPSSFSQPPFKPNTENKPKATKCFKCQGFGHIASNCPTRRTITIIKGTSYEISDEEEAPEESEKETEPTYDEEFTPADHGESLVIRRSLHAQSVKEEPWLRHNIFHTRCTTTGKVCDVIIDSGSCENVVSNYMVEKLKLPTQSHPHPYKLQWLSNESEVRVSQRCLVSFSIGRKYQDEVWCDVVPMDACHRLLGRPWQYDRRAIYDGYTNTYSFVKGGVKVKLAPLSPSELNKKESKPLISLVTKEQLNLTTEEIQIVCFILLFESNPGTDAPEGIQPLLAEFPDVVPEEIPSGLPPIRDIQHAIEFIPGAIIPNRPA